MSVEVEYVGVIWCDQPGCFDLCPACWVRFKEWLDGAYKEWKDGSDE